MMLLKFIILISLFIIGNAQSKFPLTVYHYIYETGAFSDGAEEKLINYWNETESNDLMKPLPESIKIKVLLSNKSNLISGNYESISDYTIKTSLQFKYGEKPIAFGRIINPKTSNVVKLKSCSVSSEDLKNIEHKWIVHNDYSLKKEIEKFKNSDKNNAQHYLAQITIITTLKDKKTGSEHVKEYTFNVGRNHGNAHIK